MVSDMDVHVDVDTYLDRKLAKPDSLITAGCSLQGKQHDTVPVSCAAMSIGSLNR